MSPLKLSGIFSRLIQEALYALHDYDAEAISQKLVEMHDQQMGNPKCLAIDDRIAVYGLNEDVELPGTGY